MKQRPTAEVKIFAFGLTLGLIISVFVVGLTGWSLLRKGVTVAVNREWLIEELAIQSTLAIQAAMPEMISKAQEQMPTAVKDQVKSGLGEISLEIANYQVKLPAAVVNRIDSYLQATVTAAFAELLERLEANAAQAISVDSMRIQAAAWVESLQGKRFDLDLVGTFRLPVKISLR